MSEFEGFEDGEGEWTGEQRMLTGGLRRRPRSEVRVPVRVSGSWTDGVAAFVPLLARSENLSEGGMTLVTPLLLKVGSPVMCSLRLEGEPVYVQGRVAWRRRGDAHSRSTMGVEFVGASDADIEALRRVVGTSPEVAVELPGEARPAPPETPQGEPDPPPARAGHRVSLSPLQLAALCLASVALGALAGSGSSGSGSIVPRPVVVADSAEALDALDRPLPNSSELGSQKTPDPSPAEPATATAPAPISPTPGTLPGTQEPHAPAEPHAFDLQLDLSPGERLITVPTTGSADGLSHFRLASPPGVGVDLPHARAVIADGKYRIHHDGVLWLRVRTEAESTKLRVYLNETVESYEVESALGRLRLHLPPRR